MLPQRLDALREANIAQKAVDKEEEKQRRRDAAQLKAQERKQRLISIRKGMFSDAGGSTGESTGGNGLDACAHYNDDNHNEGTTAADAAPVSAGKRPTKMHPPIPTKHKGGGACVAVILRDFNDYL